MLLKQTRRTLKRNVDRLCEQTGSDSVLVERTNQLNSTADGASINQMKQWYSCYNGIIGALSGVTPRFESNDLYLELSNARYPSKYTLILPGGSLSLGNSKLIRIEPPAFPISDITSSVYGPEDLAFLVREVKNRVCSFEKKRVEYAALNKGGHVVSVSADANGGESVAVAFQNGASCELRVDGDYPRPHSRVVVVRIEGTTLKKRQNELDKLRDELNAGPVVGLCELVSILDSRLN